MEVDRLKGKQCAVDGRLTKTVGRKGRKLLVSGQLAHSLDHHVLEVEAKLCVPPSAETTVSSCLPSSLSVRVGPSPPDMGKSRPSIGPGPKIFGVLIWQTSSNTIGNVCQKATIQNQTIYWLPHGVPSPGLAGPFLGPAEER